jgi:hypothetical protein
VEKVGKWADVKEFDKGLPKLINTDIEQKTRDISVSVIKKILQSILKNRQIKTPDVLEKIHTYFKRTDWFATDHFKILNSEKNHIAFERSIAHSFPVIAREWHPTKNDPLIPEFFTPGSNRKVWWKCLKGEDHEWKSTIANRIQGKGCPICSNQKITGSNSLLALNPKLASEWHPTKNDKLKPNMLGAGSNQKVWWLCSKNENHEWQAVIVNRNNGGGCPICKNKKIIKETSLGVLYPKIAVEWHPTKNRLLTPFDVGPGAHKKAWWKCPKGDEHIWETSIRTRIRGYKCAVCTNKIIVKSNCLATLNPGLAKEWHPNKNNSLNPFNVGIGTNKKVWWKCKQGHEWQSLIYNRTKRGAGCPKCKGKRISQSLKKHKKSPGQLDLI